MKLEICEHAFLKFMSMKFKLEFLEFFVILFSLGWCHSIDFDTSFDEKIINRIVGSKFQQLIANCKSILLPAMLAQGITSETFDLIIRVPEISVN